MDPERVQALAQNTVHLRRLAVAIRQDSRALRELTEEMRAKSHPRLVEYMAERVTRAESLREQVISRRLLTGRLPRFSVPVIVGKPGAGGNCDGCDQPLTAAQLVMAIPSGGDMFVHLHADCFIMWNALRPHIGEGTVN